jgi:WD40 repeat protein
MGQPHYQVGGSLSQNTPYYVDRKADKDLYAALKRGEFCYVLNCRQMGKSSLMVRTRSRLEADGIRCASLDMTRIGSDNITVQQWYKGILVELLRGLQLFGKFNFKGWWNQLDDVSLPQRLSLFIEDILLAHISQAQIVIFIDEIDSILGLNFSIDDFFALIRFCYNQRTVNPDYHRIAFAIFGVATPSDLMCDKRRTPFNIGTAIDLQGFTLAEAKPLATGLHHRAEDPQTVLACILDWTNGQPFLTQKLCQIVDISGLKITAGSEAAYVDSLAQSHLIENWEVQDEPEHFRTIRDRILRNDKYAERMLGLYQKILYGIPVSADDSPEKIDLLFSGLVVKQNGYLAVRNRIYRAIFNDEWVSRQLAFLRPYSQAFNAWIASNCEDKSRLLRGQALKDAQTWSQSKSLSDLDYQFLTASQECDRQEVQQSLEAERTHAIEARLQQEQKTARLQRILLGAVTLILAVTAGLGITAFWQYRSAVSAERQARLEARRAKLSEIRATATSAEALFALNRRLEALKEAIKATVRLRQLDRADPQVQRFVEQVLRQTTYGVRAVNSFAGHQEAVYQVKFSPDGNIIASGSWDGTIKLWGLNGSLLDTLSGHAKGIFSLDFSADGQWLVSGSDDNTLKLWRLDGTLVRTFEGHTDSLYEVVFSPDGELIASGGSDRNIILWRRDGTRVATLSGHEDVIYALTFSPDGRLIASGGWDNTIRLWRRDGELVTVISEHVDDVNEVIFSPDGTWLISASDDNSIQIWNVENPANPTLANTLRAHEGDVNRIAIDPSGELLVSPSDDGTVKLWKLETGNVIQTFGDHGGRVWSVDISPDGRLMVSSGNDGTVKLWKRDREGVQRLEGHRDAVTAVAFAPGGQLVASGGKDATMRLWRLDGSLVRMFPAHEEMILGIQFSPDEQTIATASWDGTAKLWSRDGRELLVLDRHDGGINQISFSPDGKLLATASDDDTIRLWRVDGTEVATLEGHGEDVNSVTFSPDGTLIASASRDETVRLWTRQGESLTTLNGHTDTVYEVAFSPDGEILASAARDRTVRLWQRDGSLAKTIRGHDGRVRAVAFHPNGRFLASASWDSTVKLWTREGKLVTTLPGSADGASDLDFSPDGRFLVSAHDNEMAIVWDLEQVLDIDRVLVRGCNWIDDYLKTNATVAPSDRDLCDGIG